LRFGVFEADLDARELRKAGKLLPLQEQPFQLLALLLQRPGEVVSREELQAALWPQTIVDFDHGLNKAVSKVRDVLGDSAENPRFLQTVARRGYKFLADVTAVGPPAEDAAPEPPTSPPLDGRTTPAMPAPWRYLVWIAAAAAVALVLWVVVHRVSASRLSAQQVRSLAVLPLENLSGDPSQEYFADGMTDELITQLAQIRALRVISRSSVMNYKHLHPALSDIARELNVDAVVEGSILRSGDRVRITAQLIRVPADEHIWAESFEGNLADTLSLQSKVAEAVGNRIRVLTQTEQAALQKTQPLSIHAYDDYLKGRFYWNQRTREGLVQAIDHFKSAIAVESTYAEAYAGLADSYALSGDWEYGILAPAQAFAQAKQAAYQALALNNGLSEAHTSLAFVLDLYGWDWETAEEQYRLAIGLSPGYATAHHWYAFHQLLMGRTSEGIAELQRAENLDPLSLIIGADVADALCIAHRYDESVEQSRKTLALGPSFALGHFELGQALVQLHQYEAAIGAFQKAIEIAGHRAVFDSNLAYAFAVSGRKEEALKIAQDMQQRADSSPTANENLALIHAGLGDSDRAMFWLNKAYDARFNPSILLRPAFDSLREDPRFKELRHRIGLPPG
jgi:TolB-like protein/DNA-binding winged helix-turn-helix (wHTH) protein/Flp pilus assembly protein TadD